MNNYEYQLRQTIHRRIEFLRNLNNVDNAEHVHDWHTKALINLINEYNDTYGDEYGEFIFEIEKL